MAQARSQIIYAPSDEIPRGVKSVFLAGTTSKVDTTDWREALSTSLFDTPVTIYNPYRTDWDSSWREDINFAPYREQVEWELEKQGQADIVVIYFHPATQAPISLLELGVCTRAPEKAIVVCPQGYWKRGNVQIVCKKFGMEMVDTVDGLKRGDYEEVTCWLVTPRPQALKSETGFSETAGRIAVYRLLSHY